MSLIELQNKIDDISASIKELQSYKKKLSIALDIAKTITAQVFIQNGIDRIDGNIISSLTLSKPTTKTKNTITIIDEKEVMKMGYVKFEPDIEAILKDIKSDEDTKELEKFVSITTDTIQTPAKVKVNAKRSANNLVISTDDILQLKQVS